jgi:hypothetical protein
MADNERSFKEMKRHLQSLGYRWFDIPLVLQYNKQDLPDRVSERMMARYLNPDKTLPQFTSIAIEGVGVIETLKQIVNLVLVEAQQQFMSFSQSSASSGR